MKGLREYRHDLCELIWKFNSPTWNFSQATYNTTAAAFNNPDYVAAPTIAVPTVTVDGQYDPFTPPGDGALYRAHFTGKYAHRTIPVGHNVPQEGPVAFAQAGASLQPLSGLRRLMWEAGYQAVGCYPTTA